MTHGDDVILSEAQFIVIMTLKVKQSLCPSPPVARHHKEVLVISLVTLHGVVWSQILERRGGRSHLNIESKCVKNINILRISEYY